MIIITSIYKLSVYLKDDDEACCVKKNLKEVKKVKKWGGHLKI